MTLFSCVCVFAANCLDKRWLRVHDYTPSNPEELQVSVHVRPDEAGLLQPVLEASWKLKDDGESEGMIMYTLSITDPSAFQQSLILRLMMMMI